MAEPKRWIVYVHIQDTFAIEEIEFQPDAVTLVSGDNGTGKTSVRRAIAAVFAGGTDPTMIREGAERSVIDIHLDDKTRIIQITRPKRGRKAFDEPGGFTTDLEITQPDGTPLPGAPRTFLKRLAREVAIDPSILLKIDVSTVAGQNKLAEEFTRLMPIEFSAGELRPLLEYQDVVAKEGPVSHYTGMKWVDHYTPAMAAALPQNEDPLTLDMLKTIADEIARTRTAIGRIAEQSAAAVRRIRDSLPPKDDSDWGAALEQARNKKEKIERVWQERKDEIEAAEREKIALAREAAATELLELDQEARPLVEECRDRIVEYQTKAGMQLKAQGLRQEIEHQLAAGWSAQWKYDRLSKVLVSLDELKKSKLERTAIPGVTVERGMVYVDGIPWTNVNTARRVEIVCEISSRLAGELKFLMIDDANLLSENTMKMLQERLTARKFQLLMGVVTKSPQLTVSTLDGGEA